MSVILALDIGLAALVLAVAVWTIVSREAFAAVVGYVGPMGCWCRWSGFACSRSTSP